MRLYHGSNVEISTVDLGICHPYKDFGKGFYLTDNRKHAENMAGRRVIRMGGEPIVSEFEFDKDGALADSCLEICEFEVADKEWATFVMKNRDKATDQPCHKYDIVIGPIADDSIVQSFRLFETGWISLDDLVERLKYRELSRQYFFHTASSLNYLRKL